MIIDLVGSTRSSNVVLLTESVFNECLFCSIARIEKLGVRIELAVGTYEVCSTKSRGLVARTSTGFGKGHARNIVSKIVLDTVHLVVALIIHYVVEEVLGSEQCRFCSIALEIRLLVVISIVNAIVDGLPVHLIEFARVVCTDLVKIAVSTYGVDSPLAFETYLGLAFLTGLGGDEDDTVGTT